MDRIQGVAVRAPCGHYYDLECLSQLFDAASKDESLFPPKCCRRPFPLTSVWGHLSAEQRLTYQAKFEEFSVPNRVYCARPTCSRFLGPQQHRRHGAPTSRKCPVPGCRTTTCLRCRNEVIAGSKHHCGENEVDESAIALAKDRGWARCPGCSNMVELNFGCYHMTCRCKTEFCYHCGARWKTCDCPQFEERDLDTPPPALIQQHREFRHVPPIRPPTPPPYAFAPAPEQVRRERSLPPLPERPRAARGSRARPSTTRQQHRTFRILPLPSSEPEDQVEDEQPRYVLVRIASRGSRPFSAFAPDSDPGTPVAGPSTLRRNISADHPSSDESSSESLVERRSMEIPYWLER